jgi:hypothetical protein
VIDLRTRANGSSLLSGTARPLAERSNGGQR